MNNQEQEQLIKTTNACKSRSNLSGQLTLKADKQLQSINSKLVSQLVAYVSLAAVAALLVTPTSGLHHSPPAGDSEAPNQLESAGSSNLQQSQKAALEAELNSLLQQHDTREPDDKFLSERIISRLMLGNLSDADTLSSEDGPDGVDSSVVVSNSDETLGQPEQQQLFANMEADRFKKLLGLLHNVEMSAAMAQMGANPNGMNAGQAFSQFPVLPSSQAATIKRASMKMNNLLRQHQQQRRPSYDFGLGKRPDSSFAGNVLRLGDSSLGSGHIQSVSGQLAKRPNHRYDFGLGKRVASVSIARLSNHHFLQNFE